MKVFNFSKIEYRNRTYRFVTVALLIVVMIVNHVLNVFKALFALKKKDIKQSKVCLYRIAYKDGWKLAAIIFRRYVKF